MLSTGDVARALGVTLNTVKAWIRSGQLDAVRLPSGHHRIPAGELDRIRSSPPAARARSRQWRRYEEWRERQSAVHVPLSDVLAWAGTMMDQARSRGHVPDEPMAEKAEAVARLHRALARVRV